MVLLIALENTEFCYPDCESSLAHLTPHLIWLFNLYKMTIEERSHEHALVYLPHWLNSPLFSSWHQHGEFAQCLKGHWCIRTGSKAELISSMESSSGRLNTVKDKMLFCQYLISFIFIKQLLIYPWFNTYCHLHVYPVKKISLSLLLTRC